MLLPAAACRRYSLLPTCIGYRAGELRLAPQSVLLLYTDGVTEAEDKDVNMLGEDRLLARLNAAASRTSADLVDAVFAGVVEIAGSAPRRLKPAEPCSRCPALRARFAPGVRRW